MTPLAGYLAERARRAHSDGLSEADFLETWNLRVVATSAQRGDSLADALDEVMRSGRWPWSGGGS